MSDDDVMAFYQDHLDRLNEAPVVVTFYRKFEDRGWVRHIIGMDNDVGLEMGMKVIIELGDETPMEPGEWLVGDVRRRE